MKNLFAVVFAVVGVLVFEANAAAWFPSARPGINWTRAAVAGLVGAICALIGGVIGAAVDQRRKADAAGGAALRDGPVRRGLKLVARWNFYVSVSITRAVRRWRAEPSYLLGGECRRCARCCEVPAIQVSRPVWYLPTLWRLVLWWQERVNGFVLVGREVRQRLFVFRCTHFDRETRSCDSYGSRPGMCRDYPRGLLLQPDPELLPGCGYRPVARNGGSLLRALEARGLTPDQLARLRKGLHLE